MNGLPNNDIEDCISFYSEMIDIVSLNFETVEDVNSFLDDYVTGRLVNSGFESVDPYYARVPHKDFAYYNEAKKLIVCFNYTNMEFISLHFIEASDDFLPFTE